MSDPQDPGETPETEIGESDPNADSAAGLAGGMGVSSERTGTVRGGPSRSPTPRPRPSPRTRGRDPAGAVVLRRRAGGAAGHHRSARSDPDLNPRHGV